MIDFPYWSKGKCWKGKESSLFLLTPWSCDQYMYFDMECNNRESK